MGCDKSEKNAYMYSFILSILLYFIIILCTFMLYFVLKVIIQAKELKKGRKVQNRDYIVYWKRNRDQEFSFDES